MPLLAVDQRKRVEAAFDEVARRPGILRRQISYAPNAKQFLTHLLWARLCLVPVSVIGGWACWRWATLLYRRKPDFWHSHSGASGQHVLARAALATADIGSTVTSLLSAMYSGDGLNNRVGCAEIAAGLTRLEIALLSKLTNLYLLLPRRCEAAELSRVPKSNEA